MEVLSTYEHAEQISESIGDGQWSQARDQFLRALSDSCAAFALLSDIQELHGDEVRVFKLAAIIIEHFNANKGA